MHEDRGEQRGQDQVGWPVRVWTTVTNRPQHGQQNRKERQGTDDAELGGRARDDVMWRCLLLTRRCCKGTKPTALDRMSLEQVD